MIINKGRVGGAGSEQRGPTFTGSVWSDPVLRTEHGVTINTVFFPPCARTHWHRHEWGQVLLVTHGRGYAQVRDGDGAWMEPGDVVYFPPGEDHWHGAGPDGYLTHTAISLGTTEWLDEVSTADYERSTARP
jgi:quercetin dioxygenase-like cupin family protein